MNLGLLVLPALAGYFFLTRTYLFRYQIQRESGYRLFFKSAIAGVALAVVARLIVFLFEATFPGFEAIWADYAPFEHSGLAAFCAVLALAVPPLLNKFFGQDWSAKRAAETNGDLVELVMQESLERQVLVELTTQSGKSYVGLARASGVSAQGDADLSLMPLASGYRHKDTHQLVFTTHYASAIENFSGDPEDFRVVLPRAEIMSARIFHPEVYRDLQD